MLTALVITYSSLGHLSKKGPEYWESQSSDEDQNHMWKYL